MFSIPPRMPRKTISTTWVFVGFVVLAKCSNPNSKSVWPKWSATFRIGCQPSTWRPCCRFKSSAPAPSKPGWKNFSLLTSCRSLWVRKMCSAKSSIFALSRLSVRVAWLGSAPVSKFVMFTLLTMVAFVRSTLQKVRILVWFCTWLPTLGLTSLEWLKLLIVASPRVALLTNWFISMLSRKKIMLLLTPVLIMMTRATLLMTMLKFAVILSQV